MNDDILALQSGDDTALDRIMLTWEPNVKAYLCKYISASDVDDVCQDVFVKVFTDRQKFNPKYKFSSWLFSIAANKAKNRIRWRKIRNAILLSDLIPSNSTPVELFFGTPMEENIVSLKSQGYNNQDIAKLTNLSLRKVERIFSQIRQKIKSNAY